MRELPIRRDSRSAKASSHLGIVAASVAAATLIASIAGAFGTDMLPIGARLFVFGTVIAFNAVKWFGWFRLVARVAPVAPPLLVELVGALVINLTLPLELALAYAALGIDGSLPYLPIYAMAVAIALSIAAVIATVRLRPGEPAATDEAPTPTALPQLLRAAGVADARMVEAVFAEDHYVRLHLADGRRPLLLHRFGDAVAALAGVEGCAVRRSVWVARAAVAGVERDGRRWVLRLTDGSRVPVSTARVAAARAAGLIPGERTAPSRPHPLAQSHSPRSG